MCLLGFLSGQYFISAGPFATVSYFRNATELMRLMGFVWFFGYFFCVFSFLKSDLFRGAF